MIAAREEEILMRRPPRAACSSQRRRSGVSNSPRPATSGATSTDVCDGVPPEHRTMKAFAESRAGRAPVGGSRSPQALRETGGSQPVRPASHEWRSNQRWRSTARRMAAIRSSGNFPRHRSSRSRGMVRICSQRALLARGRPPSPAGTRTWNGKTRSVFVVNGTIVTVGLVSLARSF